MNPHRERLNGWTAILMEEGRAPIDRLGAAQAWCADWLALADLDEHDRAVGADLMLQAGKAVSPLTAARCLWDYLRTARFLRAMDAALAEGLARNPGRPLHVVEAGCGPFAPMALAFAARLAPEQAQFTLLDANPLSIGAAERLIEALDLGASIRDCRMADVTAVDLSAEPADIIVCELIQRGLKDEPQVAATRRLAPFLRPGGRFLPERIDLHLTLFDAARHYSAQVDDGDARDAVTDLGCVFRLEAGAPPLPPQRLSLPPSDGRAPPHLFTRIQLLGDIRLDEFDAAITLPEPLPGAAGLAAGGPVVFTYETGPAPGLRVHPLDDATFADGHLADADRR